MKIKPLGDRVLVKRIEEKEATKGKIVIPDTAKEKPHNAKVVAVGPGKFDDKGKRTPVEVKKGDRVLIGKYSGTEINLNGDEHLILHADEILAILED